jgi:hypothetical protein
MSRPLPPVLQTAKRNSLPKDLKSIADELIAEKFGIEEEVVERKAPNPFQGGFAQEFPNGTNVDDRIRGRQGSFPNNITVEVRPWDNLRLARIEVISPTYGGLVNAMRAFDMQNLTRERALVVNPSWWNYMLADMRLRELIIQRHGVRYEGTMPVVAEVFGCKVVEYPGVRTAVLEARY